VPGASPLDAPRPRTPPPAPAATPLQSRTFATWTLTSCMLCVLCARDPTQSGIYYATMGSFAIAFGHFVLESFLYETIGKGLIVPFLISTLSFLWMFLGRNYYLA